MRPDGCRQKRSGTRERRWLRLVRAGWALGTGFAALSAFIAASVFFYAQQQSSDAIVRRALEIEIALADVFSGLQDTELGQRGYLLTGNDAFLQPYRSGSERFATNMAQLSDLVGRVDELVAPFATFQSLASAKRAEMARTLDLSKAGRQDEALAIVRSGEGKRIMDEIRGLIAAMDAREDAVVERRQARVRSIGRLVAASTTAAVILLGVVTLAALREVVRRNELSRFLPAEVADRLAEGDLSLRNSRELPAAIAFVDIRGSTELAERIAVAELSATLSRFRADVLASAEAAGGLVDKFIGDGALVVFGVHDDAARAAARSIRFAHDLRGRHRATRDEDPAAAFDIGIGIHHGVVFCGIVGTVRRLEFTVLGDAVNVAARLEKETKAHGVDLLVSEAVLRHAGEAPAGWRELPCDGLRGRQARIAVFTDRDPASRG